jgi:hypothetical protein
MADQDADNRLAEERANRYAPAPKHRPGEVGSMFAFGAVLAIIAFTSFAGIDRANSALPEALVIAISFAIPFWYVRNKREKHIMAVARELSTIREPTNASSREKNS